MRTSVDRKTSPVSLVGNGGAAETVTDHVLSCFDRRPDHPRDVLRPRRHHQEQLGSRVDGPGGLEERYRPERLTEGGAAWLAGEARTECAAQPARLGRLPGCFPAFEDDEAVLAQPRSRP